MFNSWFPESKDHLPLTWWKQHPIYLAAVVALAGAASMVVFAILSGKIMAEWLAFTVPGAFQEWHVWSVLTYLLVNPPSLWFLLSCYFLWSFGEAVERHFGRRTFVRLLLALTLVPPLLVTLLHFLGMRGLACAGMMTLEFGVFIAFATLYPRAKINVIVLSFDAWVLAAIFVGINVLQDLAFRDWMGLIMLLANVGTAYVFIQNEKGELRLPAMPKMSFAKAKVSQAARRPAVKTASPAPTRKQEPSVDDILDKISHQGMHSLTAEERRILDQASEEMKKRRG